jgi:hypothetical protein
MKNFVRYSLVLSSLFFILSSNAPVLGVEASEVKSEVVKFFSSLKREKVKDAFIKIFEGSLVLDKEKDKPKILARKAETTLKGRGKIIGYEQVEAKNISKSLYGVVYILTFKESFPLCWYFLYYKHKGKWMLMDLHYDDKIMELLTKSE